MQLVESGGAAALAGVNEGDKICKIENLSLAGLTLQQVDTVCMCIVYAGMHVYKY